VTLPAFTTATSSARSRPRRATRARPSSSRLTTVPGARTTTTTPSRSRAKTRAPASGRELSRTSASWSPGSARRGTLAETRRCAVACGARLTCVGRTLSHRAAERALRRSTMCGRPRRSRDNPAKATSIAMRFVPGFLTRTLSDPAAEEDESGGSRRQSQWPGWGAGARRGRHQREDDAEQSGAGHRPMTVKVTVAV
jgi:hypothetical protein